MIFMIGFAVGGVVILYVYLIYPLFLTLFARSHPIPLQQASDPRVTLVFCAHNEEAVIPKKIANCRALDYPADLLEFYVGSDGSTDETDKLLRNWAQDERVRLTLSPERVGKTALLNRMVPTATGDIVLFSDASTLLTPDA